MAQYQKTRSGTATQNTIPLANSCDNCPKVNASSSSTANGTSSTEMLIGTIGQLHDLQREVQELKDENNKTASFYDSTAKLNKTVRIVVILLMIVPVVQLLCCVVVVYSLGIEDKLPDLLNWILGGVGALSFIELFVGGVKLFLYENRMDEIEKKIEALSTTTDT